MLHNIIIQTRLFEASKVNFFDFVLYSLDSTNGGAHLVNFDLGGLKNNLGRLAKSNLFKGYSLKNRNTAQNRASGIRNASKFLN